MSPVAKATRELAGLVLAEGPGEGRGPFEAVRGGVLYEYWPVSGKLRAFDAATGEYLSSAGVLSNAAASAVLAGWPEGRETRP